MALEKLINKTRGIVKIPNVEDEYFISFEAIEEIYLEIKPLLKERKRKGLQESEIENMKIFTRIEIDA